MIHWTEPELKNAKTWIVRRHEDGRTNEIPFKSKQDAWRFLKTVNIYFDDKLVWTGV